MPDDDEIREPFGIHPSLRGADGALDARLLGPGCVFYSPAGREKDKWSEALALLGRVVQVEAVSATPAGREVAFTDRRVAGGTLLPAERRSLPASAFAALLSGGGPAGTDTLLQRS